MPGVRSRGRARDLRGAARGGLRRARALLTIKGYDTTHTTLACYSGAGFEPALQAAASSSDVLLVDLARLYQPSPS
jgi:hypothetical protein